jgi:PAS domain S-box-containing protein
MNPTEPDPNNASDDATRRDENLTRARWTSRAERWFRTLVQNSSDILAIFEDNGTVRYMSPTVERILGYKPEELVGTSAFNLVHPEDGELASRSFAEALENDGEMVSVEFRIRAADGSWRYMETILNNLLDAPDVAGIVANSRDLTERKEAEEAIERLAHRNRLILNSAGEGIYGLDREGRTAFVNPAAAALTGYEPDELIGKHQHDIVHHSRPAGTPYPEEECPIHSAIRDGEVQRVDDEVFWRKDGTSFPVEYTSTPIQEDGEVVGAVVTFTDVTERKRAEEALRESEERYRAVMEQSVEAIYLYDAQTKRILESNAAFRRLMGFSEEELLGMRIYDFIAHDNEDIDRHVRRSL